MYSLRVCGFGYQITSHHMYTPYTVERLIQWNPSITDTIIQISKLVLLTDVSFVEGSFNV